jgi:hypothetical protein
MCFLIESLAGRDEFSHVVSKIDEDSHFAFALTCRAARKEISKLNKPLKTTYNSLVHSIALVRWSITEALCVWDPIVSLCTEAAKVGNLNLLKIARLSGYPWHEDTCAYAALGGHLQLLQWARKNGCPWDERTCRWAAKKNHLKVLKWAHENDCPWHIGTMNTAAGEGHLEVLKYASAENCPNIMPFFNNRRFNYMTACFAAEGGHIHVLEWLFENGCEKHSEICNSATDINVLM